MQIVIDIDDNTYVAIKHEYCVSSPEKGLLKVLWDAIQNGTPFPKGHGDLKDVGECNRKMFYQQCGGADSLITVETAFEMLLSLPTIIKADKESEE